MRDIINRPSDQSERAIVAFACVAACVLASAHATWVASGHRITAVDPRRLALCLSLIAVAFAAGFQLYLAQWTAMPRNGPPRRLGLSPKYGPALRAGIIGQLVLFFVTSILLIGGLEGPLLIIICGYWILTLLIICRHPQNPTAADLAFIRVGTFGLLGLIPVTMLIIGFLHAVHAL